MCPLCDVPRTDIAAENRFCVAIWTHESPPGSVMVLPLVHRCAPWDLSTEEWAATQDLLRTMQLRADERHRPDGWNVGWNVGRVGGQSVEHAHCHLIPRYRGELYEGKGVRWWFKQPENALPRR